MTISKVIKCIISFYPFNIEPIKFLCQVIMINLPTTYQFTGNIIGGDENFDAIQLHTVYTMHTFCCMTCFHLVKISYFYFLPKNVKLLL